MYTPDYSNQNNATREPNYRPVERSGGATWIVAIVLVLGLGVLLAVSMFNADGTDPAATAPAVDAPAATQITPADPALDGAQTITPAAPAAPAQ